MPPIFRERDGFRSERDIRQDSDTDEVRINLFGNFGLSGLLQADS